MAAKVEKINVEQPASPKTLLGMLIGHSEKIDHIASVVIYNDGTYQLVNTKMPHSAMAFCSAIIQHAVFKDIDGDFEY